MSLSDFLGETIEIEVIDFLVINSENEYNISEIEKHLKLTKLQNKINALIKNNIVIVIKNDKQLKYKLADNRIVNNLIKSSFAHSFYMIKEE